MSLKNFEDLAQYVAKPGLPNGYPSDCHITLYSPEDNLHEALTFWINQVEHSLSLAMYGFDDDELATAILRKLRDENIFVQLCLDSVQAAGKHESKLLTLMDYPSNVVAFGQSEAQHRAIMHLKTGVMDGLDTFSGSTNWSTSGEHQQDNELTFDRHPMVAFRTRNKIDIIHASMLTQMDLKARKAAPKPEYGGPGSIPARKVLDFTSSSPAQDDEDFGPILGKP